MDEKCSVCGSTLNLQKHHVSYSPEMTVALCSECHEKAHHNKFGEPITKRSLLGRPRGESNLRILAFNLKTPEDHETLKSIDIIADREKTTRSDIIRKSLREYVEKHIKGNYQTILGSFAPGGVKSNGQLEQEIINEIIAKFMDHEVKYLEITKRCRAYGFKKDVPTIADRIGYELSKRGFKVWR